jgi:hypothetical protein
VAATLEAAAQDFAGNTTPVRAPRGTARDTLCGTWPDLRLSV